MTERDKYLGTIQHKLSEREVLEQLAEEAAELAQAALKVCRAAPDSGNPAGVSMSEARADLTEEIVDVLNAVYALVGQQYFDGLLELHKGSEKWRRWAERISERKENAE